MKITHHIATGQFEFVEVEYDTDGGNVSAAEVIRSSEAEIRKAITAQAGLPTKEWNKFLERILLNEPNHIEDLEQCSDEQRKIINEVKKALARIEAREPKELRGNRENE